MARKLPELTPWEFNPTTLQGLDLPDLKALYSKKRDIASKRLKRLQGAGFKSEQAEKYPFGIPTLKEIKAASEGDKGFEKQMLVVELADLNMWLENKYTLVKEVKRVRSKTLSTLHKHGYDFVTKENLDRFIDFQNYLKQAGVASIYDSTGAENTGLEKPEDYKPPEEDIENLEKMFNTYEERGGSLPPEYFMRK